VKILPGFDAYDSALHNDAKRFPDEDDPRSAGGFLLPTLRPKFVVPEPAKVFTIGSCFARNIEEWLVEFGVQVPTLKFAVPQTEWKGGRPNGLLNEFNPGTIAQRILSAVNGSPASEETVVARGRGFLDLLMPGGPPVSRERVLERRAEVDSVYTELLSSDLVVITLGLVEAWHDELAGVYLNRMPDARSLQSQPGRYSFRRFDVQDSLAVLRPALVALSQAGVKRVLLTVSPVPLRTTFTGGDGIVANNYSKSVLRVCAETLTDGSDEIDYFPSYEIAMSAGLGAFDTDQVHVLQEVVEKIVRHMLHAYLPGRVKADAAA
jgi:hypothetical protein